MYNKYEIYQNPRSNVPDCTFTVSYNVEKDRYEAYSDRGILDAINEHTMVADMIMLVVDHYQTDPFKLHVHRRSETFVIVPILSTYKDKVKYTAHAYIHDDGTRLSTNFAAAHSSLIKVCNWIV